jgi:hypothetical protein
MRGTPATAPETDLLRAACDGCAQDRDADPVVSA